MHMHDDDIDNIVCAVLDALSKTNHAEAIKEAPPPLPQPSPLPSEPELSDLGSLALNRSPCIAHPRNAKVLEEFLRVTKARVAVGKAGPRPTTLSYLHFLADHARSRDTVIKDVPDEWLEKCGLWSLCTEAKDKQTYLTRPDLGRSLSKEGLQLLKQRYPQPCQVQIVLSDGLSTDALLSNYEEILPPLLNGLKAHQFTVAAPFFLRHGRVKAEDIIGETVGCDVIVLLIGERPGLGQSESMSCYAVYRPTRNTVESDRTVISNIHANGMPPVEAAAVIVELVASMLRFQCSGIQLNQAQEAAEKNLR